MIQKLCRKYRNGLHAMLLHMVARLVAAGNDAEGSAG